MGVTFSRLFPPQPTPTLKNVPSQAGKVFVVTGGSSGIGFELAMILYRKGGRVYIAGRSEANAYQAIEHIRSLSTEDQSSG
jgi:NAD(P)-dependent dehydrogenase (short-subunit alcohol dehydrogenase family)